MVNSKLSKKSLKLRSLKLKNKRTKKSRVSRKNLRKMKGGNVKDINEQITRIKRIKEIIHIGSTKYKNPYEVLGVENYANITDCHIAFLKLSRLLHPDKCPVELESECTEIFQIIKSCIYI